MSLLFENKCEGCGKEFNDHEQTFIFATEQGRISRDILLAQGNKTVPNPLEVKANLQLYCRPCFKVFILRQQPEG